MSSSALPAVKLLKQTNWIGLIMGLALLICGGILVWVGTSYTEMFLFGIKLVTTSIGVVGMVAAVAVVVLGQRRTLKSLDRIVENRTFHM